MNAQAETARVQALLDTAQAGLWPRALITLLLATLAWALLLLALAWMLDPADPISGLGDVARRLPPLARETLDMALWAAGFVLLLAAPAALMWGTRVPWWQVAGLWALSVGTAVFGFLALVWLLMAGAAWLQAEHPLEALPGVSPPYLDGFIARNPDVRFVRYGRRKLLLAGQGQWVQVDGDEVAGTTLALEACAQAPDAAQLGGLPLFPGSTCVARLSMRQGSVQRVTWLFELPHGPARDAVNKHYGAWAQALGAQAGMGSGGSGQIETWRARRGDQQWDLQLLERRNHAPQLRLHQGGRTLPWAKGPP